MKSTKKNNKKTDPFFLKPQISFIQNVENSGYTAQHEICRIGLSDIHDSVFWTTIVLQ